MENFKLDKLIIGHNQFFGVSHYSSEKGIQREIKFEKTENIMEIIRHAYNSGATGLMMSTHHRAKDVAEAIRNDPELKEKLNIYVLLPYIAKYVKMANEKGLLNMVTDLLSQTSWSDRISIGMSAGIGVLKKDHLKKLQALIDLEMTIFKGLNVKAVYLHNSLTDLCVGLDLDAIIDFYISYIEEKYSAQPAFCSLSSYRLMNYFKNRGIQDTVIMAPFNPIGYQMNPSREDCERSLQEYSCQLTAMSVLGAGVVRPDDAKKYLNELSIESFIVGASSKAHIDDSFPKFLSME